MNFHRRTDSIAYWRLWFATSLAPGPDVARTPTHVGALTRTLLAG